MKRSPVATVNGGGDLCLAQPRAAGTIVTVSELDQLGAVALEVLGADVKRQRFARAPAERRRVAEQSCWPSLGAHPEPLSPRNASTRTTNTACSASSTEGCTVVVSSS